MDLSSADAAALLSWYRDAGVDMALAETPVDRFEESRREAARPAAPRAVPLPPERLRAEPAAQPVVRPAAAAVLPDAAAPDTARAAAAAAATLDELRAIME
ncbi:hypothetical protein J8J27_24860, partial [Mycobacterium tuberculosis]|nr:hypothetical protein [Mycobacterium tuberculosis]